MRMLFLLGVSLLLAQAADPRGVESSAADGISHLRYERSIQMPSNTSGQTCAVLDAQSFAHMASRSSDDLRVFRETDAGPVETPFALTESGAEPGDAQSALVKFVSVHGDTLDFDLAMPHQLYTAVELKIAANNFTAEATVTGSDGQGGPATPLGTFTLFDFTREHLARLTELPLQESHFALLHVSMRLQGLTPTPAMIAGATVPPSREAQTLHTVVASTSEFRLRDKGWRTVAELDLPEHVPVESVRVTLDPAWQGDFLRGVTVQGEISGGQRESVEGEIWRVIRPAADGGPAIHASKLTLESVLAINLRAPAKVTISLKNGTDRPLPVRSVALEMRQRMFCFSAAPNSRYTLRYGDPALHAPVYTNASQVDSQVGTQNGTQIAKLGPEVINPTYAPRPLLHWQLAEGRSQMFWIGLLAVVTLGGSLALHRVRHERKKG